MFYLNTKKIICFCKKEFKFFALTLIGIFPILVFLDLVLDVQIARDYGFAETVGFSICVIFYAEITKKFRT